MSANVPDHPGVRRSRQRLQVEVQLEAGGKRFPGQLLDVSMSGARLRRPEGWSPGGAAVHLELTAAGGSPVSIPARVVREGEQELALRFVELPPGLSDWLGALLEREGRLLQEIQSAE